MPWATVRIVREALRMFIAVTGTVLAAAACSAAAMTAASTPGWEIVASYPQGSSVQSLAASGPGNAWAVENCAKPCVASHGEVLRQWTGTAWQPRPLPSVGSVTQVAAVPGSTVAWAITGIRAGSLVRGVAVRWTGKSWAAPVLFPVGVMLDEIVAEGPSDVWVFGFRQQNQDSYAAHYNGKTWQTAPSPGFEVASVAARSASDVWVLGIGHNPGGLGISHWNGRSWTRSTLPALPAGVGAVAVQDAITTGPQDVWAYGYQGSQSSSVAVLLHLHGNRWTRVTIPYQVTLGGEVGPIASDGSGGVWVVDITKGGGFLYHDSAAGHWTTVTFPAPQGSTGAQIYGFAQIPGSASVYAYGMAYVGGLGPGYSVGMILKR
jgi:hypothetical protein